jgi:hypothetical protein
LGAVLRASALVLVAIAIVASPARAELRVHVDSDADCADASVVEAAIREAVGSAEAEVEVAIRCGPPVVAEVVVGTTTRTLELSQDEVADLPAALALIASVAVETAEEEPPPAPQIRVEAPPAPTPPAVPRLAIDVMLRGGAWLAIAPVVAPSFGLGVGVRFAPPLGIELELSATPPMDTAVDDGRVRVVPFGGRIAVCADGAPLEELELGGCAGIWLGNLYAESDGLGVRATGTLDPWVALDARLRATLVLGSFFVRAEVAFAGAVVSPAFVVTVDGEPYEAARVGPFLGWAGLAVGVRLFP